MIYYIKIRPYVAQRLGIDNDRYRYADGNVLIWDKELGLIDNGWVFHPEETVARIGGLLMDPYRNRDEQAKSAEECTPLPLPTDPEWMDDEIADAIAESVAEMELEAIERTIEEVAETRALAHAERAWSTSDDTQEDAPSIKEGGEV